MRIRTRWIPWIPVGRSARLKCMLFLMTAFFLSVQHFINISERRTAQNGFHISYSTKRTTVTSRPSAETEWSISMGLKQGSEETSAQRDYGPLSNRTCSGQIQLLMGHHRQRKGFLTVGISSVPRDGEFYLPVTLSSLHEKLTGAERDEVVIVVYLASFDKEFVNDIFTQVHTFYNESLESGLLQIIQPEPIIYHDMDNIKKRTYNDSLERVHWRTKQNVDYGHLFGYCENISQYYIHLEDDVIAATGFLDDIKAMIVDVNKPLFNKEWFELSFSGLGFIGKLYRSRELCSMKKFFLLFKVEKPCDLLIKDLRGIMQQQKEIKRAKSLFQHIGITSSLAGKTQKLTDRLFKDRRKSGNAIEQYLLVNYKQSTLKNPNAEIRSSLKTFGRYLPHIPYISSAMGFYWAETPSNNSVYRITFRTLQHVNSIVIKTGHPVNKNDFLTEGEVWLSQGSLDKNCEDYTKAGPFEDGQFSVNFETVVPVQCIEIRITKDMDTWLIIWEIVIDS
ncbi:alpha-1,6-mannosyl-glycoprotein 4-beta-N-acetylglucosaminyltransferase-like [Mya arenaria]|uniref:alpha-1,6-mannosyl-glycoprotein 4-beta-N-acetylglucosaminyltransferase-like n=1 Tax=Mya arenaria TaxID=6604 RepID=UPI0022DED536|nr:alpha-1,6-mannosyl-glycoprotein 4-beta-N-acetylglucosaminyltransferase-like [Mya arenaria]XP_052802325.1 alpha-1,6-mannosyl-glycoprotein 4-beta-N-acetylglucosaminyltransferase-like [Mya arenaria]XP_052802326.1 alpha-1,6-mannosyl-glycoprotein 4-beta-N-acetylglucosaminyltransferase-like [Mya arenaria]